MNKTETIKDERIAQLEHEKEKGLVFLDYAIRPYWCSIMSGEFWLFIGTKTSVGSH